MMAQVSLVIGTIMGLLLMVVPIDRAAPLTVTRELLTQTPSVTATMTGTATPTPTQTPTSTPTPSLTSSPTPTQTPMPPEYEVIRASPPTLCFDDSIYFSSGRTAYHFWCSAGGPGDALAGTVERFDTFIEAKAAFDERRGEAEIVDFHGYEGARWRAGYNNGWQDVVAWWANRWLFVGRSLDNANIFTPPDPIVVVESFYVEAPPRLPLDAAPLSLYLPLLRRAAP